ncbi:hypothetical protein JW968_00285 [Candidatus Woesearchaeota archaeon]|nr:hypothetical protein [Candidatus Woesearchaeota archaeon]
MAQKKIYSRRSEEDRYVLVPSNLFLDQIESLSSKARSILDNKLSLALRNPFRNKSLKGYRFLFRIRFQDNDKEKRLIYPVENHQIRVLCILDRSRGYKDLKAYLRRLGY